MSVFDPDTFLQQTATDAPSETEAVLLPEGDYDLVVKKLGIKETQGGSHMLLIRWFPELSPDQATQIGLDPQKVFTIQQRLFLDIDTETGKLEKGKNVNLALGRVRDAVNQNRPGEWRIMDLMGCRARGHVVQVQVFNDPGRMVNEVSMVSKPR